VIGTAAWDALVPLYQDPRSDMPRKAVQHEWVEQAGLVKLRFFGLKTRPFIQNAVDQIQVFGRIFACGRLTDQSCLRRRRLDRTYRALRSVDDEASYKLYASAKTVAVFPGGNPAA